MENKDFFTKGEIYQILNLISVEGEKDNYINISLVFYGNSITKEIRFKTTNPKLLYIEKNINTNTYTFYDLEQNINLYVIIKNNILKCRHFKRIS